MKRHLLNLGAILAAFLIGLTINNACADSLENMSDTELRKLVAQLQQEINSLKNRVADLEGRVGSSSGSSASSAAYAFEVDGIHFGMGGGYLDPIDYYETGDSYQIINGERKIVTEGGTRVTYKYDSYGRIASYGQESSSFVSETRYSYSNKTITLDNVSTYKNPSSYGGLSETGTTYTYKLK